jgi:fumarate hydratase class II
MRVFCVKVASPSSGVQPVTVTENVRSEASSSIVPQKTEPLIKTLLEALLQVFLQALKPG